MKNTADSSKAPLTLETIDRSKLSPMMKQYVETKEKYSDSFLFYRLGDFYELFLDDALLASQELEIVLTGRECGLDRRAPMCGVPAHSVETYIKKLVSKGYKVAICEQLQDPKEAKGMVERGVVRVVTPGTIIEENSSKSNYLMAVFFDKKQIGLAFTDMATGEFWVSEINGDVGKALADELERISPAEIIVSKSVIQSNLIEGIQSNWLVFPYEDWAFKTASATKTLKNHFGVYSLESIGINELKNSIKAAGALIEYLNETQKTQLSHINKIAIYYQEKNLVLGSITRKNLEITKSMRSGQEKGSLLWLLDKTNTSIGARMLKKWVESPLRIKEDIELRLDAVQELKDNLILRKRLADKLSGVYDIERLLSKLVLKTFNARDALALKNSLEVMPEIKEIALGCNSKLILEGANEIDLLSELYNLLDNAIAEDPPNTIKEGNIIKDGFNENIDRFREAKDNATKWMKELEEREREESKIKTLKVGFNKIFGYYIEVTKSNIENVPFRYIRKQTLANAERYITPELKELEDKVLGASEKAVYFEYDVFCKITQIIENNIAKIQKNASVIATLDVIYSLAQTAAQNNYCRPELHDGDEIDIKAGRHPIVEQYMDEPFTCNDIFMNNSHDRMMIITGPNMSGKSTFMRQVAIISIMAHIGSFVSAESAKISIMDRVFTRIGATDDLASGQSTFMVEMSETANILNHATDKSLILLDEIGRGTSTFDGLSIAWAVSEYIADKNTCGAKTLFSTHYHELSELESIVDGIVNYRISAKETGNEVVFLHKVIKGGTQKSFGIQVAKLAGIPKDIIKRAKELLERLEQNDKKMGIYNQQMEFEIRPPVSQQEKQKNEQLESLVDKISTIDINTLTPMQALSVLNELIENAKGI